MSKAKVDIGIHGGENQIAKLEKVVIVGGGVGVLTKALALRCAGVEIEVHEKHPNLLRLQSF